MAHASSAIDTSQGNTATPSLGVPSGSPGDQAVWFVAHDQPATVTDATGLEHLGTQTAPSNDATIHAFRRVLDGSEGASFTVTLSNSRGGMLVSRHLYSGRSPAASAVTASPPTTPSGGGTATAGDDVIAGWARDPDSNPASATATGSGGWTERADGQVATTTHLFVESVEGHAGGAFTSAPTMTPSGETEGWAGIFVCLAAAAAAAKPPPTGRLRRFLHLLVR